MEVSQVKGLIMLNVSSKNKIDYITGLEILMHYCVSILW